MVPNILSIIRDAELDYEICETLYFPMRYTPIRSSNGQKLFQLAESIVDRVQKLIDRYLTLKAAAEELPFPRGSLLFHLFNTTVYSLVFGKAGLTSRREREIAIAGEFDRIRIVLQGKKERCFDEAWEEIKARNGKSPLGGKFNGHHLKDIEEGLKSLNSRNTDKKAS